MSKFRYLLGTFLFVPTLIAMPVAVYARNGADDTVASTNSGSGSSGGSGGSSADDATETKAEDKIKEPSTDATAMKKRLDDLKKTLKVSLDAKTKLKIEQKCKPAQTLVQSQETNSKESGSKRAVAYHNILDRLNKLVTKLEANSIDATALKADIATLTTKVTTFETDMTAYRQSLTDLRAIDCTTDPEGFKAALEASRTAREKVRTDALDIRTFIKTTLKTTIKTIRDQVKAKEENESTEEKPASENSTKPAGSTDDTTTGGNQ